MYTYSIIITRNGQEIKKFLDFLPVLSIYFSIECQLLLEVKSLCCMEYAFGIRPQVCGQKNSTATVAVTVQGKSFECIRCVEL